MIAFTETHSNFFKASFATNKGSRDMRIWLDEDTAKWVAVMEQRRTDNVFLYKLQDGFEDMTDAVKWCEFQNIIGWPDAEEVE